jgi:uncharacterized alkaline shock family protein YloU
MGINKEEAEPEGRMQENLDNKMGSVRIDSEVLGSIAAIAAKGVSGVYKITTGFVDGIAHLFRKNPDAGVKVILNEGEITVELGVIVEYGSNIPEITWNIQKTIKEELERQSGLRVVKVNVVIAGVHYLEDESSKEKGVGS